MILLLAAAAAVATGPDTAVGRWRTETRNGIVAIDRCGASLCGRLVGSDGLTANPALLDSHNKDAGLRNRRLMGLEILRGFAWKGDRWGGGTIYKADDGATYKGTITTRDADHLQLQGCIVWPLCRTQTWTRVR